MSAYGTYIGMSAWEQGWSDALKHVKVKVSSCREKVNDEQAMKLADEVFDHLVHLEKISSEFQPPVNVSCR